MVNHRANDGWYDGSFPNSKEKEWNETNHGNNQSERIIILLKNLAISELVGCPLIMGNT